jgi:ribokinase
MITVVGSLNMDLVVEAPVLPAAGETVVGRRYRQSTGGKGANQACALARLGVPVQMMGCVGSDAFGREMTANLSAFGVGLDGVMTKPGVSSGVAFIIVDERGENQIVVCGGANETLSPEDIYKQAEILTRSRAVIAQLETPLAAVETAFRIGREAGAVTILNPAPAQPLSDEMLGLCDWIIPNKSEAARLLGQPSNQPRDPGNISFELRQRAPAIGVVITLGANGAWLDHRTERVLIPSFWVEAVDTVGAGDAFVGAFAARLVEGASSREAVEFATAAAALAVTRPGAQAGLPSRTETEALLRARQFC